MPPSSTPKMEAFPPIMPTNGDSQNGNIVGVPRQRRRKSSALGADPHGDTGANSIATSDIKQQDMSANTPRERGRKRRKAKTFLSRSKKMALKHTWLVPLILTLTILAAYFVSPGEHNPFHSAIFLSYANPPLNERTNTLPARLGNVTQYGKGIKDFAFVAFYTIVLSFTREFLMQRLIRPIALYLGIRKRDKQARFMEQFYTAVYFSVFGPLGLYVMYRTPVWYFNTAAMYEGFPHRAHDAWFKAYYLLEGAYWAQQAIVLLLMLEKPRKDFRELVLHHIVTLALIGLSYRFHFTYIGVAVYITHDISDFFLATSKCLNYVDSALTPYYFAFFIVVWGYGRHFLNLRILYSMSPFPIPFLDSYVPHNEFATVGPYDLDWSTQQYKCWISQSITFALLLILQAVNLFWFFLIARILVRYLKKGEEDLKDDRSEDEDDGEEEPKVEAKTPEVKVNGVALEDAEAPATGVERVNGQTKLRRKG